MPIVITSRELTANHKREVREEFNKILLTTGNKYLLESEYTREAIEELSFSKNKLKRDLSNYLMAIYMYLDFPGRKKQDEKNVFFINTLYEKQLLAVLIYFINVDDVIPDHIAYIGYLDDAYCVNLALSKQNNFIKEKIEKIVESLKVISG